jgi:predicted transposase/invertase (TIGR01784 family)
MLASPHDTLFKALFSNTRRAAEELRTVLPPEVASRIDWSTLTHEPSSYIDEKMRHKHADLLFSATMDGQSIRIYLLFEHQSTFDRAMPRRLLRYMDRIWDSVHAPDDATLPIILPVVLYHGEDPWPGATDFHSMFTIPPGCAPYVPQFRFQLEDLTTQDITVLQERAVSACVQLGLRVLKAARSPEHLDVLLLGWRDLIYRVMAEPFEDGALRVIFQYILETRGDEEFDHAIQIITEIEQDHTGETMESIAQKLINRGHAAGRTEGHAAGHAAGRIEGRRAMLLETIELRLGEVPKTVRGQIEAADERELQNWLARALRSNSVDELLTSG